MSHIRHDSGYDDHMDHSKWRPHILKSIKLMAVCSIFDKSFALCFDNNVSSSNRTACKDSFMNQISADGTRTAILGRKRTADAEYDPLNKCERFFNPKVSKILGSRSFDFVPVEHCKFEFSDLKVCNWV